MSSIASTADGRVTVSWRWGARTFCWPAALLVVLAHVAWGDPAFTPEALFYAGLIGAIALIGVCYVEPFVLPLLPILLIRFYFAMAFPVFTPPRMVTSAVGRIRISSRTLEDTTFAGLVFVCMIVLVFHLVRPLGRRGAKSLSRLLDRPDKYGPRDTITARCLTAASITIYLVIAASPQGQGVFGALGYPATLVASPVIPLGLLFWDAERTNTTTSRLLFWGAVGALSVTGLGVGMLGSAVEPLVHAIVFMWTVRGRLPTALIVSAVTMLIALNSAKHEYRVRTWNQGRDVGVLERGANWLTAIEQTYSGDASDGVQRSAESTASRLSSLILVAHMFEWVPGRVPFAGPKAWLNLPLSFVPRAIWNDKPSHAEEFNNNYTTTFRIQTRRQTRGATFTLPSIGDGYWRLGWLGVLLEGAMFGMLAGWYQGLAEPASRGLCIIGAGFVIGCGPESHVLGILAMQPQFLIAMFATLWTAQGLPSLIRGAILTKLPFKRRSLGPGLPRG